MKTVLYILLVCLLAIGCKNVANYPITEPSATATDARVTGKWQFEEDTNKNNYYEVYPAHSDYPHSYHIRFWNRGGTNPTYESNLHFSDVNGVRFINVPYFGNGPLQYGFLKILESNSDFTKFTAAVVGDEKMEQIKSAEKLKAHIIKNINNPKFYSDTVHFFKQ
jgi:hypothetical protein